MSLKEYSADTGTPIEVLADVSTTDHFHRLPLVELAASLTNPRKHFNVTKLAELAESIKASGVHQPILVRPLPGARVADTDRNVSYEIVSGERRYRASQMAGVASIPALVRSMTDDQVLEAQMVENLQRDDLTALEEAEGYERLMAHSGIAARAMASKIGMSPSYVLARLKLLDLSHDCKQAMRDGGLDASIALLIARIPDTALQARALKEASRKNYDGEPHYSVRTFNTWLQANVMLKLANATFKITDARLVESAGSCTDCPKRTGANPDLFSDVTGGPDLCTDPTCFNAKATAHSAALRARAEAKGYQVIEGKEAEEICDKYRSRIEGYSRLSQVRDDATTPDTLGKLLGKDAPAPVLIENPWTKELIEAVPTDEAEGILLAKGLIKATEHQEEKRRETNQIEYQIDRLKTNADLEINAKALKAQHEALVDAVHGMSDKAAADLLTTGLLREWLMVQVEEYGNYETLATCANIEVPDNVDGEDYMRLHFQAAPHHQLYRAAALFMVDTARYTRDGKGLFVELAKTTHINLDNIAAATAKEVKAQTAAKIAELKKALKTSSTEGPAAQATGAGGEAKPKAKAQKSAAPMRKAKLSAEEAITGIAAAMQGMEAASADAVAPPGSPSSGPSADQPDGPQADTPVLPFPVGTAVRIIKNEDKLQMRLRKHAGKAGTVTALLGVNVRDVSFKGRTGGIAAFDLSELEAA